MRNIFSSCAYDRFSVARISICLAVVISCFFLITVTSCADKTESKITVTKISLSELQGKISANNKNVLIVDFWATWCPPCRKEIPGFVNLYKKYKDKGVEIIGVSLDRGGASVVQSFINSYGVNYPVFLAEPKIAVEYKIQGIPTTIIIGKDGKTKSTHVGFVSEGQFEKEILALLK